jgi:uncharacterized membrane protein
VHSKHKFLPPEPFLRISQQTCPLNYFRSKSHVLGDFAQFRCRTSTIPKTGRGFIKVRVFATRTISSFFATNMPNPLLKVQNSCLGWFRAISLLHVTHSENGCRGAYNARVFATETISSFFARTCPIHYFRSKTHVLGGFAQFCCRTSPIPKRVSGCIKARVFATGTISSFFATNMPNTLL